MRGESVIGSAIVENLEGRKGTLMLKFLSLITRASLQDNFENCCADTLSR